MVEEEHVAQPYEQTQDYIWKGTGVLAARRYRVRVFEKLGAVPIVLAGSAKDHSKNDLRDLTQQLAAEILVRHFTHRLWEVQPMRWIEEQVSMRKRKSEVAEQREYWEVRFKSFIPHPAKILGEVWLQIDESGRRAMKVSEVRSMLGEPIDS